MESVIEFLKYLFKLDWISQHPLGMLFVILIVFAETGLFVGFFLPGDSLLFVTGMAFAGSAETTIGIVPMILLVSIAGILGNMVAYWFGKKSGPLLFKKKDTFLFKKRHLQAAKEFYDKRGAMTIFLARFLPIVRTFAPIVAGIVRMPYRTFMLYNIVGSFVWVSSMILLGYSLGNKFPILKERIEYLIIGIVFITTLPVIYKLLTNKKKPAVTEEQPPE
jgi:membrane-associated protein